jgi:hypothetical protein
MYGRIVFNRNFPLFAIENYSAVQVFWPTRQFRSDFSDIGDPKKQKQKKLF